ncbi:MAG: site-specific DNA-methyltransferase, partial [Alphaproteobacteria bacterium]
MISLEDKKQHYLNEINKIAKESFNDEQKKLACDILNSAHKDNIDSIYTFITQRVKLGFVFDVAPEVAHDCVALCERDNKKSFGNELGIHHKLIIGENYDALKNLVVTYTKNGKGLIDVIYIDPPYNTEKTQEDGNDYKTDIDAKKFIYRDKFSRTGWLNMMRERLVLARKLLSDTGVIFISIDDTEQAYLKVLCDEIFGEENFVCNLIWQKKKGGSQDSESFSKEHEYILCYQKQDWRIIEVVEDFDENNFSKIINGRKAKILKLEKWGNHSLRSDRPTLYYPIKAPDGSDFYPMAPNGEDGCWRKKPENLDKEHIYWQKNSKDRLIPYEVIYYDEIRHKDRIVKTRTIFTNYGTTTDGTKDLLKIFNNKKIFDTPKPVSLIKKLISLSIYSDDNSLILDFFAGSGTTAQAVMELNAEDGGNRQCILVTNNEN